MIWAATTSLTPVDETLAKERALERLRPVACYLLQSPLARPELVLLLLERLLQRSSMLGQLLKHTRRINCGSYCLALPAHCVGLIRAHRKPCVEIYTADLDSCARVNRRVLLARAQIALPSAQLGVVFSMLGLCQCSAIHDRPSRAASRPKGSTLLLIARVVSTQCRQSVVAETNGQVSRIVNGQTCSR